MPRTLPAACPRGFVHVYRGNSAWYDVAWLWKLTSSLPRFRLNADHFPRLMDTRAWEGDTPNEHDFDGEHWDRVLEASFKFPVMTWDEEGSLEVVDGFHRITKAFLLDRSFVLAVDVTAVLEKARLDDHWEINARLGISSAKEKSA